MYAAVDDDRDVLVEVALSRHLAETEVTSSAFGDSPDSLSGVHGA